MNKRIIIFSSVFLFLAILLGIKTYDVLADTQNEKKSISILQTTIEDRAIAIGVDGTVKVFETKVLAIDGPNIATEIKINDKPITIIISTDPGTKIFKNGTSTVELSTIQVDDTLAIAGELNSLVPDINVIAQEIRIIDLSRAHMKVNVKAEGATTTSESSKVESNDSNNDTAIIEDQASTTTVISNEETQATTTTEVQSDVNTEPTDTEAQSVSEPTVTEEPVVTEPATEEATAGTDSAGSDATVL